VFYTTSRNGELDQSLDRVAQKLSKSGVVLGLVDCNTESSLGQCPKLLRRGSSASKRASADIHIAELYNGNDQKGIKEENYSSNPSASTLYAFVRGAIPVSSKHWVEILDSPSKIKSTLDDAASGLTMYLLFIAPTSTKVPVPIKVYSAGLKASDHLGTAIIGTDPSVLKAVSRFIGDTDRSKLQSAQSGTPQLILTCSTSAGAQGESTTMKYASNTYTGNAADISIKEIEAFVNKFKKSSQCGGAGKKRKKSRKGKVELRLHEKYPLVLLLLRLPPPLLIHCHTSTVVGGPAHHYPRHHHYEPLIERTMT